MKNIITTLLLVIPFFAISQNQSNTSQSAKTFVATISGTVWKDSTNDTKSFFFVKGNKLSILELKNDSVVTELEGILDLKTSGGDRLLYSFKEKNKLASIVLSNDAPVLQIAEFKPSAHIEGGIPVNNWTLKDFNFTRLECCTNANHDPKHCPKDNSELKKFTRDFHCVF